jgi:hypothetical protein
MYIYAYVLIHIIINKEQVINIMSIQILYYCDVVLVYADIGDISMLPIYMCIYVYMYIYMYICICIYICIYVRE